NGLPSIDTVTLPRESVVIVDVARAGGDGLAFALAIRLRDAAGCAHTGTDVHCAHGACGQLRTVLAKRLGRLQRNLRLAHRAFEPGLVLLELGFGIGQLYP